MERLEDLFIDNLKIYQNDELYCFTSDAVLLSKFATVKKGDKVCAEIIENNLLYTTTLIKDALSVSEMANPKIAFVGGVTKETVFREKMQTEFGKEHTLAFSTNKPIYGAVRKAVTLFGGTIHENFENNFEKTIKGM